MTVHRIFIAIAILFFAAAAFRPEAQPADAVATTPVYAPDYSHQNDPLPDGVLVWDASSKSLEVTNGLDFARFVFTFTNRAAQIAVAQATNVSYVTNFTIVTNTSFWRIFSGKKYTAHPSVGLQTNVLQVTNSFELLPITILNVHPSCGCTTAELPPVPWRLPPGTNGTIKAAVNLAGKSGLVIKTITVSTDKGRMDLMLRINILPAPPTPAMTEADRARGLAAAKVDRQAVFKGDCVSCHAKNVEGKFGPDLFTQVCAICHEAEHRASMVPDLHNLKEPTSPEFWRTWITSGKAGTLMPAFATSQGGPLTDMQITSLAIYLNGAFPSHAPAK